MKTEQEGVIKFRLEHEFKCLARSAELETLMQWRDFSRHLKLIGQDEGLYGGLGYGNISVRHGHQGFLISGSQTGAIDQSRIEHYAWVHAGNPRQNKLSSVGTVKPSSESMTHEVLYLLHADIHCVLHAHSAIIWQAADKLALPATSQHVAYGTPEMAQAVTALCEPLGTSAVFVMKGHQDGVVSYGRTAAEAIGLMTNTLAAALLVD